MTNPGVRHCVGYIHSCFLSFLTRFVDNYSAFWGPIAISVVVELQGALTCRSSTLALLADSGPFSGPLLTVWGPIVISTIDEPRGVTTCRSSRLTVFVNSEPFHGLLINILESQSDFHGCRIPRSAYVLVVQTRSFG